jgi:NAD(P)-dependent dehydrogenase (short-subunit alcohol dehydrogenase family)
MMQRTVAITGCSSGFGRILVQLFLKEGWQVLAGLRRVEQRTELFAEDRL